MKNKRSHWHVHFTYGGIDGNTTYTINRRGVLSKADITEIENLLTKYYDQQHGQVRDRIAVVHTWQRYGGRR